MNTAIPIQLLPFRPDADRTVATREVLRQRLSFIELETSSACARKCTWCPTGLGLRPRDQQLMGWPLFHRIVSELAAIGYAGELSLHGLNEPLQNPRLFDEYALARDLLPDAQLTCYTNGDLLNADELRALSAVGVTRVRVTLHAARIRPVSDERRLTAFLSRFGIDDSACTVLDGPGGVRRDFHLDDTRVEVTQPDVAAHFNDRGGLVLPELSLSQPRRSPCDATATKLAISYTGHLKMCCNVSSEVSEHDRYMAADLNEVPIVDAYMSTRCSRWRSLHAAADWSESPVCATCRHRTIPTDEQ